MRAGPALVAAIALAAALATPARADDEQKAHAFWKFPPLPKDLHPQFSGEDPIGLRAKSHIPTNCTINVEVETGKVFCFGSIASREMFLEAPKANEERARAFFEGGTH